MKTVLDVIADVSSVFGFLILGYYVIWIPVFKFVTGHKSHPVAQEDPLVSTALKSNEVPEEYKLTQSDLNE